MAVSKEGAWLSLEENPPCFFYHHLAVYLHRCCLNGRWDSVHPETKGIKQFGPFILALLSPHSETQSFITSPTLTKKEPLLIGAS